MYHVVFLVTRKPGMSQDEFIDYWINRHTPLTAELPGSARVSLLPDDRDDGRSATAFDAVAYIAFDDEASCKAALESEEFTTAVGDGVNFQNVDETYGFFAREYRIV